MPPEVAWMIVVGLFTVAILQLWFAASLLQQWRKAQLAGAPVSLIVLIMMKLRGSPAGLLVDTFISLKHRGVSASIADVERTYLAIQHPYLMVSELADEVERRL